MIAHLIRRRAATLALLLLAACASAGPNGGGPAPARERTMLRVRNSSFTAYTIYVLTGTDRRRLGDVQGVSTATFDIPPEMVSLGTAQMRFLADPLGSSAVASTYTIGVRAGDTVTLTLQ